MSKSFLELLENLKKVSTREEKKEITGELSLVLEEDEKHSERLLQHFFNHTLGREVGEGFQEIIRGEFFSTRVKAYLDEDYSTKIAVGIAYLQDSNNYVTGLDEKVIAEIVDEVKDQNLEFLVNDISVNGIQFRNGERTKFESEGS